MIHQNTDPNELLEKMTFTFDAKIEPPEEWIVNELVQSYVNLMEWFERLTYLNERTLDIIMHEFCVNLERLEKPIEYKSWAYRGKQ